MLVSCKSTDCKIQFATTLLYCPICGEDAPLVAVCDAAESRSPHKAKFVILAVFLVLIVLGPFRFSSFSICDRCGAVRNSSQRQLPLVNVTYWTSHDIVETSLSQLASSFAPQHEHSWLFGHGGGNSVMCALGPAGSMRGFTSDTDIVHFLALTHKFLGPEAANHYLSFALDPEQCRHFSLWLQMGDISGSQIETESDYQQWVEQNRLHIVDYSGVTVYQAS